MATGSLADPAPFLADIGGRHLECRWHPPARENRPALVFLHDGIGSLAMWRDFPARLAAATGCGALVYSRWGCGWSSPREGSFTVDYMHREAFETLPALLDAKGIANPVLVGQSDGASIALLHAGGTRRPVRALILEAPHIFVEPLTIASIEQAKDVFEITDFKGKLARYHKDPAGAFTGWNDIWLLPAFRSWNIEAYLPFVTCPVLAIQGRDDEYGTLAQVTGIEEQVAGPCETLVLADCGHTPHRDQAETVLEAMRAFIAAV